MIQFPRPTFFVAVLDSGDMLIQKLCPIITGGVCVGSIYWTMVTFGAVTVMQTVGHDRSLVVMERADPMLLLVSLPLVPVGLIIGQMIRWEETVSNFFFCKIESDSKKSFHAIFTISLVQLIAILMRQKM